MCCAAVFQLVMTPSSILLKIASEATFPQGYVKVVVWLHNYPQIAQIAQIMDIQSVQSA